MTEAADAAQGTLTPEQVRVIAAGLYYVASVDGVAEEETKYIQAFLKDAGHPELQDELPNMPFELERAVEVLDTTFLRKLFVKACILIIEADHHVSPEEEEALRFVATAFGLDKDIHALEAEVEGESLE